MLARPCIVSLASSLACCILIPAAPLSVYGQHLAAPDALPDAPLAASVPARSYDTRPDPSGPISLRERFMLQTHTTFAPLSFILPAAEAGITMAHPPDGYPRDWADGGGAFARNYGSELGRHSTAGYAHFAAAAVLREDPRYYPSHSHNYFARSMHAIAFTFVDRNDAGHRTFAASNFVGAAAGGFIGMTWEPDGFDDVPHAYQRSAVEVSSFASHNLISEFAPELTQLMRKVHLAKAQGALMPDSSADKPGADKPDTDKPAPPQSNPHQ